MGSSGGDSGAGAMAMLMSGSPIPGLPVAGKDSTIGDPYKYGQFQNFLPEPVEEGPNPLASGLRPEMFKYRSPGGLRDELAAAVTGGAAAPAAAAGGTPGTMGLGGRMGYQGQTVFGPGDRGGPAGNGIAPPANATQLPTPQGGWVNGNLPHWPPSGPGTPQVAPGVNTDPAAAAAAAAALKASGG